MSRETLPLIFALAGFLALGGGGGVAAYLALRPVPAPPFAPVAEEAAAVHEPDSMLVYVPLDEQLAVSVAEQPVRVILTLAVSLRASMGDLITLKAAVDAKRPALLAAMLAVAQVEVAKSADPVVLMGRLPGPLRKVVNEALATEALPEPVEEVLITGLMTQ